MVPGWFSNPASWSVSGWTREIATQVVSIHWEEILARVLIKEEIRVGVKERRVGLVAVQRGAVTAVSL